MLSQTRYVRGYMVPVPTYRTCRRVPSAADLDPEAVVMLQF